MNIYLKIYSIKLPNTWNNWDTTQKGAMNFPDRLHKCLLDNIIRIGALEFIKYGKYDHQEKEEDPNNDMFSFLNITSFTFSNGCGHEHNCFASSFNSKSTGYVYQVPSVPLNKSLNLCNNFSTSLRFVIAKCWYWVSITFCKSAFLSLAYKITWNILVAARTCYDSYTSST